MRRHIVHDPDPDRDADVDDPDASGAGQVLHPTFAFRRA